MDEYIDFGVAPYALPDAIEALKKAMEIRHIWMQALSGKISKEELDARGVRFMAVTE